METPQFTVLLAEDEYAVRALCSRVLRSAGYRVLEAADGAEAVELARIQEGRIDLFITDVVMPGMSGREAADAIRSLRPETQVLFISGYTDDDILRHGVLRGLVSFLPKPFSPGALLERVRDLLQVPPQDDLQH